MYRFIFFYLIISLTLADNSYTCDNKKNLFTFQKKYSTNNKINASAKHSSIKDNIYYLNGDVEIMLKNYIINADNININKKKKIAQASGNVKLQLRDFLLTTNNLSINASDMSFKADDAKYNYLKTGENGKAKNINLNNNVLILKDVSYSLCAINKKQDWQIKASEIILDKKNNKGKIKHVRFNFFDIPIFYFPVFYWALEGRTTGILLPGLSNYSNNKDSGYELKIPYYFNIAPDKDLLLTAKYLSSRGLGINSLYRQLLAKNKADGYLESDIRLIKDKINNKKRWLGKIKFNKKITDKIKINLNLNKISDKLYFEEIENSGTDIRYLYSNATLSYKNNNNQTSAYISANTTQTINNGEDYYIKDLDLYAKQSFKKFINTDIVFSTVKFSHKDNSRQTGIRSYADITFNKKITNLNYWLNPSININTAYYNLANNTNKKRTIYSFKLDSKLFFIKKMSLFNTKIKQNLVPEIAYLYTPKIDQQTLPNFDSEQLILSYDNLFSNRDFSSIDRINAKNNIALGISSDFIDDDNGNTYATLKLARSFNIKNNNKSNMLLTANFFINNITINNTIEFNNVILEQHSVIDYKKNGIKFAGIAYHHTKKNNDKNIEIYASYPMQNNNHIFGTINKSLDTNKTNRITFGYTYNSCCFSIIIAHFKKLHTPDNSYNNRTSIRLVLKGFSSTGRSFIKKIKKEIPNYLPKL